MDLAELVADQRRRGIVLVIGGTLLLVSSILLAYNTVPLCTPNYSTDGTMVTDAGTLQRFQDNRDELQQRLLAEPASPQARDIGPVYAFYNSTADRFWVVHTATISGDQLYGPFDGRPRTCTFYPEKR